MQKKSWEVPASLPAERRETKELKKMKTKATGEVKNEVKSNTGKRLKREKGRQSKPAM